MKRVCSALFECRFVGKGNVWPRSSSVSCAPQKGRSNTQHTFTTRPKSQFSYIWMVGAAAHFLASLQPNAFGFTTHSALCTPYCCIWLMCVHSHIARRRGANTDKDISVYVVHKGMSVSKPASKDGCSGDYVNGHRNEVFCSDVWTDMHFAPQQT